MALTQEDLLAISTLLDKKLKAELIPIKNQLTHIEVDLLENNVLPRLDTIESCSSFTGAYATGRRKIRICGKLCRIAILSSVIHTICGHF